MKKIVLSVVFICSFLFADLINDGTKALKVKEYTKACDGRIKKGCYNLGNMYYKGQGVKQDYFKAVNLFKKICNSRYASGCTNLGVMYFNGQGVKENLTTVKKLFGKACDLGSQNGCKNYTIFFK
ncbi:MAG: hypothetical protein CL624_04535 [Arcobacter sp.]|nr:hypothetical protein [Arcobacter sp.]|tara:strand:+ start:19747 stop:20121 length:375 start_codon:yes stop_codon:yes gene_type:complete